ncbi:MAG TPA: SDR family oxidoreductase [Nocardioidaceae bacterium]|nr:SDR family oxidoreductase [Nocardioidaceae bacterium]
MTILVTGTSGHLGRLIVEALLVRGVPASEVVATARNLDSIADLAARGVAVRRVDYNDPASLKEAFVGVDKAILVSSSEVGNRVTQHANVIDAATDAGLSLLAYTSIANADRSTLLLAADHQQTEQHLADSGLPVVLLRNSWYVENWTEQIPIALEHGAVFGAAGNGVVSAATRADYAEAAAAALTLDDQAGKIYELGGTPFTLSEYAAELSVQSGQPVTYQDLPTDDYVTLLEGAGLPNAVATVYADADRGLKEGELLVEGGHLEQLIGRPSTQLSDAIKKYLA